MRRGDAHGGVVMGIVRIRIVRCGSGCVGGTRQDGRGAALLGQSGVAARGRGARVVVGIVGEEFLFETEEGAFSGIFGDLLFRDLLLVFDRGGFAVVGLLSVGGRVGVIGLLSVIGLVGVGGEIGLRRLKGLHRLMGVLGIDGRSNGRTGLRRIGRTRSLCRVVVLNMTLSLLPLPLLLLVNVDGPTRRRRIRLFRNAILISLVPPVMIPSRRVRIHFLVPPAAAAPPVVVRAPSPDAGVTRAGITPRAHAGGDAAHAGPRRGMMIRASASREVVRGSRPHADVPVDAGSIVRYVRFVLLPRHGGIRFGRPSALLLGDSDEVGGGGVGGGVVGGTAADMAVSMGFGRGGRGFFGFGFGGGKRCFHCGGVGFEAGAHVGGEGCLEYCRIGEIIDRGCVSTLEWKTKIDSSTFIEYPHVPPKL
mmetsp:Transcript_11826/g.24136  ORF Transcript_11826/g.24136 Transcript_11826/m.24136 type:complete len:421 (-) Transcript_11826:204-1466(-)